MSGHSKFANIKHKKEKNDAKKGKIFTVIGRELVMAVKAGGPDPNNNSKLRDVIAKAKANNMPNDTIERGIKKAAGADSADNYEKAVYEGYGPNGVAIIVETLTDNKNRTAGNVRNAFTKGNGSIGTQGCVSYMFDQKGQIIIDKEECEMDADEIMMLALDAGAEDFSEEEDSYEILTAPDDFSAVREALEKAGLPIAEAQVAMIPQTYVELTDEQALKDLQRTLDLLEFLCKISLLDSPLPVRTNCRWFIHSESVVQSHIVLHWDNADTRSTAHDQTDETFIQFFFRCCMITQIISRQFSLSCCDALPPSHDSFIIMGSCICHAVLRIIMWQIITGTSGISGVKRKFQNLHSREAALIYQMTYRICHIS